MSKGRFLKPEKLQNHSKKGKGKEKKKERGEEKERRKRKSEERKRRKREKHNGSLFFYNSYFGDTFWPEKTVGRKRSILQ